MATCSLLWPCALEAGGVGSPSDGRKAVRARTPEPSNPVVSRPGARPAYDDEGAVFHSAAKTAPPSPVSFGNTSSPLAVRTAPLSPLSPLSPPRYVGNTFTTPSRSTKAPPRRKRTTAAEAYNKGLLLPYILDSARELDLCNRDCTVDYESTWQGHQPLTPSPWEEDDAVEESPTADPGSAATTATASEQRLMRRRRRRGVVLSPPRGGDAAKVGGGVEPTMAAALHNNGTLVPRDLARCSIPFPEDVVDPHILAKERWHPSESSVSSGGSGSDKSSEASE